MLKLKDRHSDTEYWVSNEFANKALDFKQKLNGRKPTRAELRELLIDEDAGLTVEIEEMFSRFAQGHQYGR